MMKILYAILFFCLIACEGKKTFIPDPEFVQENFFEFMTLESEYPSLIGYDSAFIQEDSILVRIFHNSPYFYKFKYYTYNMVPVYEFFTYYYSGEIYCKERLHGQFLFKTGKEYFFDNKGNVIKIIDHEEPFSFSLEDVYSFADKHPLNLHKIKRYKENTKHPYWYVTFEDPADPEKALAFYLDGQTGEVFKEYEPVKRTKKLEHPLPFMLTMQQYDEYIYGETWPELKKKENY